MKQSNIPYYNDPEDFDDGLNKYPCSTKYMYYNGAEHKYYLTREALNFYGLNVERKYISDSTNKVDEFINLVTKKVYDYIGYKSGWKLFPIQMYRIATGNNRLLDPYEFRHQFELALVSQAKYIIENGDSARYSGIDLEKGEREERRPEDEFMNISDIAPETRRALKFMGLDRWFSIHQVGKLDTTKF